MKTLPPFVFFILRFTAIYTSLSAVYYKYLKQFEAKNLQLDPISNYVAKITQKSLQLFDLKVSLLKSNLEPAVLVFINPDKAIVKIIEGCNSISIIILFASFIFAFYSGLFRTFLFILLGSLSIFTLNILRIDLFILGLHHYPQHKDFLHDILFPLSIYGYVLLLWLIWIFKLNKKP
ncbi:exosortase family protein XrtF [Myroides guanonis]|uniref:Exosortase family protein XrtF n=1 Tax=Myroides guanonis TaxID=1150112 RepID=A0A1I3MIQ1_9FLAO|nr:exosortase family protein XrtF [Myroides guanonis]SFI96863.1 exosortase family protein XrtF [Myroides guanonis]